MKKFLVAIVAAAFCCAPARAAPPAAPAFNWTGFYLGGNFGYGVARDPSGSALNMPIAATHPFPETFNVSPRGALGGGQIGYNWQAAPNWVWGIEADIQASAQTDSTTCVTACNVVPALIFTQVSQKLPWFGTLRGRVGWANGPALYYVTGGWAFGKVTTDYAALIGAGVDSHSFSHTQSGWTVGGGIETALAGNWTAKIEYLYVNLGNVTDSFVYTPVPANTYAESSAIRNHVVRVGLNYKFGDPLSAPTARSGGIYHAPLDQAAFNWSGFYLGGNLGYGVARNPNLSAVTGGDHEAYNLSPRGALGGGQIGYNWQAAPNWVWGIEADIQDNGQTDLTTCVTFCIVTAPNPFTQSTQVSQKLPWFGTLRGRVGWTNGPALYYVTGGWAFGKVTTDYAVQCCILSPTIESHNFSHTQSGWTVGGGTEIKLTGNWSAKFEYLYVNLGNVTGSFAFTQNPAFIFSESSAIRNHVARVGLNYKFGNQ